jgi:hypothetical protein
MHFVGLNGLLMAFAGSLWVCLTLSIGHFVSERLHRGFCCFYATVLFFCNVRVGIFGFLKTRPEVLTTPFYRFFGTQKSGKF